MLLQIVVNIYGQRFLFYYSNRLLPPIIRFRTLLISLKLLVIEILNYLRLPYEDSIFKDVPLDETIDEI